MNKYINNIKSSFLPLLICSTNFSIDNFYSKNKHIRWSNISDSILNKNFINKYYKKLDLRLCFTQKTNCENINILSNKNKILKIALGIDSYYMWINIQNFIKLSVQFILKIYFKHIHFVKWDIIAEKQELSDESFDLLNEYIDWSYIYNGCSYNEKFVEKWKDKINWNQLIKKFKFNDDFVKLYIEKYKSYINFKILAENQKLTHQFIIDNFEKFDIEDLLIYQKVPEKIYENINSYFMSAEKLKFIEKNKYKFDQKCWFLISEYQLLDCQFLEKYSHNLNQECWNLISRYQKILSTQYAQEILQKFENKFDQKCWKLMSKYQQLPSHILEKYEKKIDWKKIAKYYNFNCELSSIILKNIEPFWNTISQRPIRKRVSRDFVNKFGDKLVWDELLFTFIFKDDVLENNKKYFNKKAWEYISRINTTEFSIDFLKNNKEKLYKKLILNSQLFKEIFGFDDNSYHYYFGILYDYFK